MASAPAKSHDAGSVPRVDPALRVLLRYSFSPREYAIVYERLLKQSPNIIRSRAPLPASYDAEVKGRDDFNLAALRACFRALLISRAGLKLWEGIKAAIARRRKGAQPPAPTPAAAAAASTALLSNDSRLSVSIALLLLFHRVLHRFLSRLRANLLNKTSQPFRRRNPRVSRALTSRIAPAVGASLAGLALAASPAGQLRISIAIYASTRAAEFTFNALEADGWFKDRPWWFGSWILMPGVFGELLYAFVFENDCFPPMYGNFIMRFSDTYLQKRPSDYPSHLPWPETDGIVRGIEELAKLKYPPFESPILHPKATLPSTLSQVSPIASPAHPGIASLSCAILHPSEPSCMRTYLQFYLQAFPRFARFFAILFAVFSLPRLRFILENPGDELDKYGKRVLRVSLFLTGSIATAWGSICLFQKLLPRGFLPKGRFFLGGFLAGFWALLVRKGGRGLSLYSLRTALDSTHKLGSKKKWWKGPKGADLLIVVASLATINVIFEKNPEAINSGFLRRVLSGLRGEGWADRVKELGKKSEAEAKASDKGDHAL